MAVLGRVPRLISGPDARAVFPSSCGEVTMFSPLQTLLVLLGAIVVAGAVFFWLGYIVRRRIAESKIKTAERIAAKITEEAERESENTKTSALLKAKDEIFKLKEDAERETERRQRDLKNLENRLRQKEESLERRADNFDKKEQQLGNREKGLERREGSLKNKEDALARKADEQNHMLERISGMSAAEAKEILMKNLVADASRDAARTIKEIKDRAVAEGDRLAREIISLAIQRCASNHVAESTVSVVELPNDEMKGRIIGREGRNIRAIEAATGVDLIVDDTPEAVIVSSFDPVRREVAKRALERLIVDGRIHPGRVEEIVDKIRDELEQELVDVGEETILELNINEMDPELVRTLGRLKYRTSYGQNVLRHSKEVAYLAGIMANELGLPADRARRAGLLHDVGKAVDHEVEGTHPQIGADLLRKFGESPEVVNACEAHHGRTEPTSVEAVLVAAADAISAARPGARRESLESYIKRITRLEEIADSFSGVSKAYAIQAGREVRIIVEQERVSDAEAEELSRRIAETIEKELEYPGKIKVVVIRETRAVDYAK
jgi:ribonuclease Y